jgi:nucleoside-diphosphate-sugar epimerase
MTYEEAYGRSFDDMLIRQPDLSKIKRLIGFEPKFTLEQTLQQVIDFERQRMGDACCRS